jgi:hypothetical protein
VGRRSRSVALILLAASVAGMGLLHFRPPLDDRSIGWSLGDAAGTPYPWFCNRERDRSYRCHELFGDDVPFSVERVGRQCWRLRRLVATRAGGPGSVARTGCHRGWDRVRRGLGAGPSNNYF